MSRYFPMFVSLEGKKVLVVGAGSVADGVRWLQERSEIVIDPERCPNAAREFAGYEYPVGPDGEFLPELPDRDNHAIDALRYAMEPVLTERRARTMGKERVF